MDTFNWGDIIFQLILFGLLLVFTISFSLFIRRILLNSTKKNTRLHEIEKKLDKLIEKMEEDKK